MKELEIKKESELYPTKKVTITFFMTEDDAANLFERTSLVTELSRILTKKGVKFFSLSSTIKNLRMLSVPPFVRKKKHPWIRKDINKKENPTSQLI